MAKQIFLFIVLIRALAAIIITNSHYTGVYPTDLIANGGLLGDVLFFSVSGFCLASTQVNFDKWYLKRFIRVYIPTWLMTVVYIIIGAYVVNDWNDIILFFVWPTHWHFVASIILLYIPLYFVAKYIELNTKNYCNLAVTLFLIQLILYVTVYNTSYYHIDKVREPMIEFLFFQAMLLGVHYRWKVVDKEKEKSDTDKPSGFDIFKCFVLFVLYFGSKIFFSNNPSYSQLQILNQLILFSLLYCLFGIFMKLEWMLKNLEASKLWPCVKFLADRTLEIYLVQYVILDYCKIGPFPMNWIILTFTILTAACILHWISQIVLKKINNGFIAHRLL